MPASKSSFIVDGLTSVRSSFGPKETMERVEAEIRTHGLNVCARIDHAAGAADVGLTLPPTELIIFGNARGGTSLMQASQTAGIDLPLKALVWEDAANNTWLSYNEPSWIVHRHGLSLKKEVVEKLANALTVIAKKAAGPYDQ